MRQIERRAILPDNTDDVNEVQSMDKPLDKFIAAQRVLTDHRRQLVDRPSEGDHSLHELIDRFCDPLVQIQGAIDVIERARSDGWPRHFGCH